VVVDEMLLTSDLLPVWMAALAGLDVLMVQVTCPLAVAEQRERARGNESGLARGHFHAVHDHDTAYDMVVGTTTGTPTELARAIL
jgi:chloramphenicol 3-O phosphotransferase